MCPLEVRYLNTSRPAFKNPRPIFTSADYHATTHTVNSQHDLFEDSQHQSDRIENNRYTSNGVGEVQQTSNGRHPEVEERLCYLGAIPVRTHPGTMGKLLTF
ncbi:hypothetical protein DPMN_046478 [Dreissena polymorpha]|uniref:Uncharacterized protein n=1 Tax=Dreissena polymorpha TaxID=45954 RepID=A0A9D4D843_DREPO|nr:hypothetical protein DPMN_046478 [Dreissena polymorpha]